MKSLVKLVKGYKSFIRSDFPKLEERYKLLAENGQNPKIMMIGCCDSRVNPEQIFNTLPGDLFVVRNVANLVPPFEPDSGYHGTSAAIEFAVNFLNVEHIVVMGHRYCGGIRNCCEQAEGKASEGLFLQKWTSLLKNSAQKVRNDYPALSFDSIVEKVEHEGIKYSLENLMEFPFIKEKVKQNKLEVHGAFFDVQDGQLYALDKQSNVFQPIE